MTMMWRSICAFSHDESGASSAEYALLLAIIGMGVALAAGNLGEAVAAAMIESSECIDAGVACGP